MVAPVGTIQAFSETSVTLSEMLREPQLWSAEKPHLYDIHIKLRRKNELLESFEYHWGIRKIEIAGDVFKVNGKAVKSERSEPSRLPSPYGILCRQPDDGERYPAD